MFQTYSIEKFTNKQAGFWVSRFEDMPEPENLDFPHKHSFYEILWITKGQSKQNIDFQQFEILPDTLFFISPSQLHLFENWDDIEGYCLFFTEDFLLENIANKTFLFELVYLDNAYQNPFLALDVHHKNLLLPTLQLLLSEFLAQEKPENNILGSLLFVFLKQIQRIYQQTKYPNALPQNVWVFKKFKQLLEQYAKNNYTANFYAEQLSLTQQHLNRIVKAITGKTTGEIIQERRILEIKYLLHYSEKSISEIAFELQFEDLSYFTRFFKQATQLTPSEFRNQMFK
ncbi:MAG: helix-turn-helix domain-containing protein [Cytophagales bacterium]|nr:MAG: helix-turn-helix domain-containing protein [Cytophagales bacterium]